MDTISMPVMVRFQYAKTADGKHFLGVASIPRPQGEEVKFKVLVPMSDVRREVSRFIKTEGAGIAGDPRVIANIGAVYDDVARRRAKRRLGTAIKVWRGGEVAPFEVAGPAGYATRIAQNAANRGLVRYSRPGGMAEGYDPQTDIGWNPFKAVAKGVKSAAKAVAKPVVWTGKKVGSGVATGAKAVGKGAVATGKAGWSVSKGLANNPLTSALISVVPGGGAALAVVKAVQGGSPGAQEAVAETARQAQAGNPVAQQSVIQLQNAAAQLPPPKTGIMENKNLPLYIGGGVGALALLAMMMRR